MKSADLKYELFKRELSIKYDKNIIELKNRLKKCLHKLLVFGYCLQIENENNYIIPLEIRYIIFTYHSYTLSKETNDICCCLWDAIKAKIFEIMSNESWNTLTNRQIKKQLIVSFTECNIKLFRKEIKKVISNIVTTHIQNEDNHLTKIPSAQI